MTPVQTDAFLTMLYGMRIALLGIVDALEVFLIANGKLKERTSEIRRKLKAQANCDTMASVE
jgi:hypothetical protein